MHYKKTTKYSYRNNLGTFFPLIYRYKKIVYCRVQIVHHSLAPAPFQFSLSVFDSARDKIMKFVNCKRSEKSRVVT
jgi:hypothetical protein